ncbi:MAG: MBL fold metallo-hydrolase [Candidatus Altiarchaeota archaeon]
MDRTNVKTIFGLILTANIISVIFFIYFSSTAIPEEQVEVEVTGDYFGEVTANDNGGKIIAPYLISEDVYYIGFGSDKMSYGIYLVNTTEGGVIIDNGCAIHRAEVINKLNTLGFAPEDIKYVLNTHAHGDHVGADKLLQDAGAKIVINAKDAPSLEFGDDMIFCRFCCPIELKLVKPNIIIRDGSKIVVGDKTFQAMEFGGHTPGSTVYIMKYISPTGVKKVYFTGDTVMGIEWFAHWRGNNYSNLTQFAESIKRIWAETGRDPEYTKYYIAAGHIKPNVKWTFKEMDKKSFRGNLDKVKKNVLKTKYEINSDVL